MEKKDSFKLNPAQAALFVELFSGKILKSDTGKYYIISDMDLDFFIKRIESGKITEEEIEKKIKALVKKLIPKDKPEINASH